MHQQTERGKGRRRRRGANAVEFAMIALPLTMIVLGTMEYGWLLFNQIMLDSAAREGARVSARTATGAAAAGEAAAQAYWDDLNIPGDPTFTAGTDTEEGVSLVRIDAVLTYDKLMGPIAPVPSTLEAHVTIRNEIQP